jgi:hypothetical protein
MTFKCNFECAKGYARRLLRSHQSRKQVFSTTTNEQNKRHCVFRQDCVFRLPTLLKNIFFTWLAALTLNQLVSRKDFRDAFGFPQTAKPNKKHCNRLKRPFENPERKKCILKIV